MSYKTSKCRHGDRGMCIHCMVNRHKMEQKGQGTTQTVAQKGCKHPPTMKCLRCMPASEKIKCTHAPYEYCAQCQHTLTHDTFSYYLNELAGQCLHQKPCRKCLPPLSRPTLFLDPHCKRHLPYPQAMCEACMAPTLTIAPQSYSHLLKVKLTTTALQQVADSGLVGVLLGYYEDGIAVVTDVYFPQGQCKGATYLDPQSLPPRSYLFEVLGLEEIGIVYQGSLNPMALMLSSLFQERYSRIEQQHQKSRFFTMRLTIKQGQQPHFQCFMVSDQMQALHRSRLLTENPQSSESFSLVVSPNSAQHPTFLREGSQTDQLTFKDAIVWIRCEWVETSVLKTYYPYFTLESHSIPGLLQYIDSPYDPLSKYTNVQCLLHLQSLMGGQNLLIFLNNYLLDHPDEHLRDQIRQLEMAEHRQIQQIYGMGPI